MAVQTLLAFASPIVGICVEIVMASQAVNYGRMNLMPKHNSRSLVFSEFFMIEKHHRVLAKSIRCKGQRRQKNRKDPRKPHQPFLLIHISLLNITCSERKGQYGSSC